MGQRGGKTLRGVVLGSTAYRLLRLSRSCTRCQTGCRRHLSAGAGPGRLHIRVEAAPTAAASLALDGDILLFHVFKSVREDVLRDADVSEAMIRESLASEGFTLVTRMRRSVSGYS